MLVTNAPHASNAVAKTIATIENLRRFEQSVLDILCMDRIRISFEETAASTVGKNGVQMYRKPIACGGESRQIQLKNI